MPQARIYTKKNIDGNLGQSTIKNWREEQMERDVINLDNEEARTYRSNAVKSYVLRFNDSQVMHFAVEESLGWCAAIEKDNTTTVIQRQMVESNQAGFDDNPNGQTLLLGLFEDEKDKEIIKFIMNTDDIVSVPKLEMINALVDEDTDEVASPATSSEIIGNAIKRHKLLSDQDPNQLASINIDDDIKEHLNNYKYSLIKKAKNEDDVQFLKTLANYIFILKAVMPQLSVMDRLFRLLKNKPLSKGKVVNFVDDNSVLTDNQKNEIKQAVSSLKAMFKNHLSTVLFFTDSDHPQALLAKHFETQALYQHMHDVITTSFALGSMRDWFTDYIHTNDAKKAELLQDRQYHIKKACALIISTIVFASVVAALVAIMPGSAVLTLAAPIFFVKYCAYALSVILATMSIVEEARTIETLYSNRSRSLQVDDYRGKREKQKELVETEISIEKPKLDDKLNKTITLINEKHCAIGREKESRVAAKDIVRFFSRDVDRNAVLPEESTRLERRHSFSL